ncbi:MAG TPA: cell division protein FtsA [Thermoanaerobacterales bacterium]|nr:cell division protein FtsA [Thermoanaerobacterales bacterium]
MRNRNIISSIDIGTSRICAIIAEINRDNLLEIIGIGVSPSMGIKKGAIIDIDSTTKSIINAVEKAEQMADSTIDSAFINYTGGNISLVKNKGIVAVRSENKEISEEDTERVMQTARVVAVPTDKEIIDVIPLEFIVDGYSGIKDPIGMVGTRLEVDAQIIMGSKTSVRGLVSSVQNSKVTPKGIIINPLAASKVLLTEDEKDLGVALIDIGGGTSEISIFLGGNLIFTKTLPIGGNHITNDIAIGLRIPLSLAEKVKNRYGCALVSSSDSSLEFDFQRIGDQQKLRTNQQYLAEIIEPRVLEILELTKKELNNHGFSTLLPVGAVITGGGLHSLKGFYEASNQILEMPVRMGIPGYFGMEEPFYSVAVGVLEYVHKNKQYKQRLANRTNEITNIFMMIRKWVKDYF